MKEGIELYSIKMENCGESPMKIWATGVGKSDLCIKSNLCRFAICQQMEIWAPFVLKDYSESNFRRIVTNFTTLLLYHDI